MLKRRYRAGFTLVELLVVIGIIAVLISILLPAVNKASAQAKSVQCQANLRTLGQAYTAYCLNNNGRSFAYVTTSQGFWAPCCILSVAQSHRERAQKRTRRGRMALARRHWDGAAPP